LKSNADNLLKIDRDINDSLKKVFDDEFALPEAMIFAIETFNGEPPLIKPIGKNKDVYTLLFEDKIAEGLVPYTKFAVVTCGWAAPLETDEDVPPSLHSQKRRVKLTILCDNGKLYSALSFKGEKEITIDEGNAKGDLREAMLDLFYKSRMLKKDVLHD